VLRTLLLAFSFLLVACAGAHRFEVVRETPLSPGAEPGGSWRSGDVRVTRQGYDWNPLAADDLERELAAAIDGARTPAIDDADPQWLVDVSVASTGSRDINGGWLAAGIAAGTATGLAGCYAGTTAIDRALGGTGEPACNDVVALAAAFPAIAVATAPPELACSEEIAVEVAIRSARDGGISRRRSFRLRWSQDLSLWKEVSEARARSAEANERLRQEIIAEALSALADAPAQTTPR
jgi:hypothetical protein